MRLNVERHHCIDLRIVQLRTRTLEWVRLFDPVAYSRLQRTKCTLDYRRVRVPIPAFFTAAIFLSTAISKQQKIRFLLGLFDENDSGTVEMMEFVDMLSSFFQGVACLFGLSEHADMPKASSRQELAKKLFLRVMAAASTKMAFWEAKSMLASGSAPLSVIEDWFLGESGDPLSAPFALFLERFSDRSMDDASGLEGKKFRLSHTAPVEPPTEPDPSQDVGVLSRSEIKTAHDVFNHCVSAGHFHVSYSWAEQAVGVAIDPEFWSRKLSPALEEVNALQIEQSLTVFVKKLCSNSPLRLLRMYQGWLKELEQLAELQRELGESRKLLEQFEAYVVRPVLPVAIRKSLLQEYDSLNMRHMSPFPAVKKIMSQAGQISAEDFVAAMCPKEYRPKPGNPAVDRVIGDFLTMQIARQEQIVAQRKALFAEEPHGTKALKSFIKPQVSESCWELWNHVFHLLDVDGRWSLTFHKMASSHIVPVEVCDFMCKQIGGTRLGGPQDGFSKEEFLQKMLDIGNCRMRKETLWQCRLCSH